MPSWLQVSSLMFLCLVQACGYQSIRKSDYFWLSEDAVKMTWCQNHENNIIISLLKISPIFRFWQHIVLMIPLEAFLCLAAWKCSIHQLYPSLSRVILVILTLTQRRAAIFLKSANLFWVIKPTDTEQTKARITVPEEPCSRDGPSEEDGGFVESLQNEA